MGGKTSSQVFPPSLIGLLAGLSFGWGLNWPILKLVVSEMEPMYFRALCLLFGAASLMIIAREDFQEVVGKTMPQDKPAVNLRVFDIGAAKIA